MDSQDQEDFLNKSTLCAGEFSKFCQEYRIMNKIGSGGFGGVFKAYDIKNNCFVAVKRMP
jgi:serine/threonine protein kinase